MGNKKTIVVIEDDISINNFMIACLKNNSYNPISAYSGKEGLSLCSTYCPDLILLDLGLPDMNGVEVIKRIRQWSKIPIVVVSARGNEPDKVQALDLGADDYVTKPFGSDELLARIRVALRHKTIEESEMLIKNGDLVIDVDKHLVYMNGEEVHFTPIEYKIMLTLGNHIGKVVTMDALMKEVWGPYLDESNLLRVNMANIRRKIEMNPAQPRYIRTEVGVGYRMLEQ